jgi:phosphate transport system substrate-binding protein
MAKGNNDTGALLISLLITLGLIGGGVWFFGRQFFGRGSLPSLPSGTSQNPTQPPSNNPGTAPLQATQPNPQVLTMDGSVTMVAPIKQLQASYTQVNPALPTSFGVPDGKPNGTEAGLQNLNNGTVVLAASSRPLKQTEVQAGLQAVPVARDAIAIVVGTGNPFGNSLTVEQLKQIFQGQITNWSEVGGPDRPIRVINRAPTSGTASFFKEMVLLGGNFAPDGANFTTLTQDQTTPLLRALGDDGISYATVAQVENQQTVKVLPIENIKPTDRNALDNYPLSRIVYFVVPKETSPAVKQFIDLALSSQGQQIFQRSGFHPL